MGFFKSLFTDGRAMIDLEFTPYILPLVIAAAVSSVLGILIWRRRPGTGVMSFVVLMAAVTGWTAMNILEISAVNFDTKIFFSGVAYLGVTAVPVAWFTFTLEFTGRKKWLTRRNVALLALEPAIMVLLAITYDYQHLYRDAFTLDKTGAIPILKSSFGPAFWVQATYSYIMLILGNALLIVALIRAPRQHRGQIGLLLVGAFVPWVANAMFILGLKPLPTPIDLTSFAFTITGLAMGWDIYHYRLLDILPAAHDLVIENVNDGILVLNRHNHLVDANPAALKLLNLTSRGQGLGRRLGELLPNAQDLVAQYRNVEEGHAEIASGQGEARRHFQMRITPLRNRHGDLIGRLFVLHEITDLKRAAAQIQAQNDVLMQANQDLVIARQQAEEASRLKSEFLATISHELRTPLNSVIGYADLMLTIMTDSMTEKQCDYIKRIMNNGERLLTLINDILDLSKIEAGHLELVIQTIAPADLLKTIQAEMQPLASQKDLKFELTLDPALPAALRGDPKRLQQIITNLLSNAIRFTDKGEVKVCVIREDLIWRIVVTDTGIGIPPHALEFIFDEFRQVDGSYQRQYGGTGLGLAIVRKLVTLMGGTVRVESEVGKGSTFTVQLPLEVAQPEGVA
jgi:signal transduction histidine kinase